jgi:hypothetical protein
LKGNKMSKQFPYPFNPVPYQALPHDNTGDNNLGLSTNDATQRFVLGTRHMSWDGSVHKYCKAASTYTSYQAAVWDEGTGAAVSYEAIGGASAAGTRSIILTQGSITEDQYSGGYILIFHATGDGEVYGIEGNGATVGTETTLYLDRPLGVAITTSDNMELYANPYSAVKQGNSGGTQGFIGVPLRLLTDNYYGWIKTWGPTFISPQATVGNAYLGGCYFRHDGSIDVSTGMGAASVTSQYAGYVMVGDAAGDGPLIMLQVSI